MNATTETSLEAKDAIRPHVLSLRERVYGAIKGAGDVGLTDDECQHLLNMNGSTQRPRRIELARAGRIQPRRTWLMDDVFVESYSFTSSGRRAVVWVAVNTGVKIDEGNS